jgi:hypothetical protein
MIEYHMMNDFRGALHSFQGFTKNEPSMVPNGCKNNTNGIKVSVITLFAVVHVFRGFVSHNNSSANCIPHHPTRDIAIH